MKEPGHRTKTGREQKRSMLGELFKKYKDIIAYGIFGILTTIVNIIVYWAAAHLLHLDTVPATVIAWIAAVLAAYLTNRKIVFHSEASGRREILQEILRFFAARLATGIFDWVFMYVTVDRLGWNDVAMKVIANIVVIISNYVLSKLVVFRRKNKDDK